MKVYDKANDLARDLKESKEYLEFKNAKDGLKNNLELKAKLGEFEKIRYEVQVLAIEGKENDNTRMSKLQELYQKLLEDDQMKEYFDLELRFTTLLNDVNKIIGEAVIDVLK